MVTEGIQALIPISRIYQCSEVTLMPSILITECPLVPQIAYPHITQGPMDRVKLRISG
jgi:hypothetical protein